MTVETTRDLKMVPQELVRLWAAAQQHVADIALGIEDWKRSDDYFYTNGGHARAMQALHRAEEARDAAWSAIEAWSEQAVETAHGVAAEMAADRDPD